MDMECNTFYRHLIKKSMKVFALYFSWHHLLFCCHFPGYITFLCQYVSHCQHILYISTLLFPFTPTVNIYLVFLIINCISYANLKIQSSCRWLGSRGQKWGRQVLLPKWESEIPRQRYWWQGGWLGDSFLWGWKHSVQRGVAQRGVQEGKTALSRYISNISLYFNVLSSWIISLWGKLSINLLHLFSRWSCFAWL